MPFDLAEFAKVQKRYGDELIAISDFSSREEAHPKYFQIFYRKRLICIVLREDYAQWLGSIYRHGPDGVFDFHPEELDDGERNVVDAVKKCYPYSFN